jgi:hypothetical protein
MEGLVLSSNLLEGTVPREWTSFENLKELHLSSNELEGTVPAEIIEMATNRRRLRLLKLKPNRLTGDVPTCVNYVCNNFV